MSQRQHKSNDTQLLATIPVIETTQVIEAMLAIEISQIMEATHVMKTKEIDCVKDKGYSTHRSYEGFMYCTDHRCYTIKAIQTTETKNT